jgi:hypothetical protein
MRISIVCSVLALFGSLFAGVSLAADASNPLRSEVHKALQSSLRVSTDNREEIVNRLVDLYDRIASDTAVGERERQQMRLQITSRLQRLSAIIARQIAIVATAADGPPANADAVAGAKRRSAAKVPRDEVLAQQLAVPRPGFAAAVPNAAFGQGAGRGRPGGVAFRGNGAVAAQPPDNGQALVDLIQRTIEPSSWDVNGGPGSIVSFAPSRVLVVRQRSEIHQQLQDVVRGLRQ